MDRPNDFVGKKLARVEELGVSRIKEDTVDGYDDVIDYYMYQLYSEKEEIGFVEMRLNHNGYYGGWVETSVKFPEIEDPDDEMVCIAPKEASS